jgi:hypothetical protein
MSEGHCIEQPGQQRQGYKDCRHSGAMTVRVVCCGLEYIYNDAEAAHASRLGTARYYYNLVSAIRIWWDKRLLESLQILL